MRRLFLALPLIVVTPALAQSQAAMPVEPFTEGQRAGIPSRPLVVLTVSQALPVASLPASCTDGQLVLATDGRTPMQASGKGAGVVARCLSNTWISTIDGKTVQS